MRFEDPAICQDRVEMLDESTIPAVGPAQVITPCFQTKREQVREKRALDLVVEQILSVLQEVTGFCARRNHPCRTEDLPIR
jgi:hypothetical protein